MASYFGEVLPVTSRAVYEDDDEFSDLSEPRVPIVTWTEANEFEQLNYNLVVICDGSIASGFMESLIMDKPVQRVGTIDVCYKRFGEDENLDVSGLEYDKQSAKEITLSRMKIDRSHILVVQVPQNIPDEASRKIVTMVFDQIPNKNFDVVVLTSTHSNGYKSAKSVEKVPFLKKLSTSTFKLRDNNIDFLEQPNIVSGLSAAAMSLCQRASISAVLYICYTDVLSVDSINVDAMSSVLQHHPLANYFKDIKILASRKIFAEDHGNLYI